MAGCGVVFAGVAAIAAQLAESSRTAIGMACAVVAATYALRAVGDVETSLSWLTWLSPQGWANHVQPYGQNNLRSSACSSSPAVATLAVAVLAAGAPRPGPWPVPGPARPGDQPPAVHPGGPGRPAAARHR